MLLVRARSAGAVTQRLVRARRTTLQRLRGAGILFGPNGWSSLGSSHLSVVGRISCMPMSSSSSSRIGASTDGLAAPPLLEPLARHSSSSTGSTSTSTATAFRNAAVVACAAVIGFGMGRFSVANPRLEQHQHQQQPAILPNGFPRTCCESDPNESKPPAAAAPATLTESQQNLMSQYRRLVGAEHVLDCTVSSSSSSTATAQYLVGARIGGTDEDGAPPPTLCIVTPTHLHQVADIVEWAIQADCVVLVQGQNTGLTGGSVPHTHTNDSSSSSSSSSSSRPIVVLSMKQLTGIVPLDDGARVVCMAGAGLASVRV